MVLSDYQISGNIAITNWAFNLFCGAWPKILLPLTKLSSQAWTKAELKYVAISFRNLVDTHHECGRDLTARLNSTITRSQMVELHETMRTAQPLATRKYSRQLRISEETWIRRRKQSTPSKENLDYRDKQLRGIASQFRYQRIPERLWLREGVFFPFSERSYPAKWTEADCEAWFNYRVSVLRGQCNKDNDRILNADILMQVALRRLLGMAQEIKGEPDPDHPGENLWAVGGRVGLELWPYDCTPCTASIAHKIHGQEMTTGYWQGDEYPDWRTWDAERCNILFESWCWNCEKFNFPAELEDEKIERHLSLPEVADSQINEIWEIRSPADVRSDPAFQTTCSFDVKDKVTEENVAVALTFLGCDVGSTIADGIEAVWRLLDVEGGSRGKLEEYLLSAV
ncbi:hypothetical protein HO173_004366 [Letharia columbiana]|uniref:Uncharacterized protein n=1 Tax=Letharia columbiana TaxID=112416 RepID=A0A8H6FZ16_9LECA|nr:uncharacterized protein HO173_004366 [Letharia columbiana]KAF6237476.1 hypothetical protein HO173_004366 [Letharia columbiana]